MPLLDRTYLNMRMVVYHRLVTEHPDLPEQPDGWWEIKVEFERLGVPIIRAILAFADDKSNQALYMLTYASLIEAGAWLSAAFATQYTQGSADILTAAKDMGMKFLTNEQFQDAQSYWLGQTAKLELAEAWSTIENTGVAPFSEDRYSAFTKAVDVLDFDTPIEGE